VLAGDVAVAAGCPPERTTGGRLKASILSPSVGQPTETSWGQQVWIAEAAAVVQSTVNTTSQKWKEPPRLSGRAKLPTVAVREGPFSMAKSHLKLVAPTEVNRTVAPTRRSNAELAVTSEIRTRDRLLIRNGSAFHAGVSEGRFLLRHNICDNNPSANAVLIASKNSFGREEFF
jgi:hypothetical protein